MEGICHKGGKPVWIKTHANLMIQILARSVGNSSDLKIRLPFPERLQHCKMIVSVVESERLTNHFRQRPKSPFSKTDIQVTERKFMFEAMLPGTI